MDEVGVNGVHGGSGGFGRIEVSSRVAAEKASILVHMPLPGCPSTSPSASFAWLQAAAALHHGGCTDSRSKLCGEDDRAFCRWRACREYAVCFSLRRKARCRHDTTLFSGQLGASLVR